VILLSLQHNSEVWNVIKPLL